MLLGTSCSSPTVIVITSTPSNQVVQIDPQASTVDDSVISAPDSEAVIPTLAPADINDTASIAEEHVVQPGETLSIIAANYNVTLESLLAENDLPNPDLLSVGQVLRLPGAPTAQTPTEVIMPDGRLVRGPESIDFDVASFVAQQVGYIKLATDEVRTSLNDGTERMDTLTAAQIVERVSLEYSVDPRLLLTLLEYRAGWLQNPQPFEYLLTHPLISLDDSGAIDRGGLYKQLSWAANEINRGYYARKYDGATILQLPDGSRLFYAPELNAASAALQYFFSLNTTLPRWQYDISTNGFSALYAQLFGDPFIASSDPVPANLQQPQMALPFAEDEVWFYTGGPHGGWGAGSAWSAVDFAPPDERPAGSNFCYTSTSWVRAVAPGVIARSDEGVVVLDLDGDGIEETGWTILYLHLASTERIAAGTTVAVGDPIGHAACAGGFSSATHLHIARRYNGEWIPADCENCAFSVPSFVMDGWVVTGWNGLEYQGFMQRDETLAQAEQGRDNPINQIQR